MRVTLPPAVIRRLMALPESGMGHQRVDLLLRDGRVIRGVTVLNGEIAEVPADAGSVGSDDVRDAWAAPPEG